tara:strand:+ start:77 stop:1456 length:1380 start_codon:yes stop_codon:yes gene_type:complete
MSYLNHIKKFKKKIAVIDEKKSYNYKELDKISSEITQNIESRSLVFLFSENNVETIMYYLGLLKKKAVIVLLNQNLKNSYLKNLLVKYKPNYVITNKGDLTLKNYKYYSKKFSCKVFKRKKIFIHKIFSELALLLSTSGTTGNSKLVRLSYENYINNTENIIKSLNLKSSDSVVTTLPFSYTYGLSIINSYLYVGGKIILNQESIIKKDFWKKYAKYKPTSFYGVPFTYELLSKLNYKNFFTKKLNFFAQAGGKIEDNLLKKNIEFSKNNNIKYYSMYGQTEASPRISLLNNKFNKSKFNSIGKPLKGGKFKLVNEKKEEIKKPFVKGELIYYGKNVSLGYAINFKDLKKKNENNYKLFTGDIAYFDKDNFFYISGRKSGFVKIFGHRIDMSDVEKLLLKKGFNIKCNSQDNKLLICYKNKNLNKGLIKKILSNEFNINQNYIELKYLKDLKYNKNKQL